MRIEINGVCHEIDNPDLVFHKAFQVLVNYQPFRRDGKILARCAKCGEELGVYYCEDRLYAIECPFCSIVSLVKAHSPLQALLSVGDVAYDREVEG